MRVAATLKTIEKNMEKEVLEFFQLLGASETPEDWRVGDARYPVKNHDREKKPAQPSDQENSSHPIESAVIHHRAKRH